MKPTKTTRRKPLVLASETIRSLSPEAHVHAAGGVVNRYTQTDACAD